MIRIFRRIVLALFVIALVVPPLSAGDGVWTTTYPYGGDISGTRLVMDPADPSRLYAAPNRRGVYRTTDAAATWTSRTDDQAVAGFIREGIDELAFDWTGGSLYALVWQGLFHSADGGVTWTDFDNDAIPDGEGDSLATDPADAAIVYVGTRSGVVYRTSDGGATWTSSGSGLPVDALERLVIDPSNATTLYAGTTGNGIYKSTDGGATWANVNHNVTMTQVMDVAIDPSNSLNVYAAGGTSQGIYKSTDGAATWTQLAPTIAFGGAGRLLAIDPTDPTNLYAAGHARVLRSADSGDTWSSVAVGAATLSAVLVDPGTPSTVYVGSFGNGVFKSTDSGATWSEANTGLRARQAPRSEAHSLLVDPGDPSRIYSGTKPGGFKSTDGGATWSDLGLPERGARSLAIGSLYAFDNGLYRSDDGGSTWTDASNGAFCCYWFGDVAVHPSDPLTIYVATSGDGVWKTTDGGTVWNQINNGLGSSFIYTLGIDPNDGNTLYAGAQEGSPSGLWKTTDGGANWFQLGGGLPGDFDPRQIVVHPQDSNLVLMAAEGSNNGVWRSDDGGGSWARILDDRIITIAVIPGENSPPGMTIFAGASVIGGGFQRSIDSGATWALINEGLPLGPGIESMQLDPSDSNHIFIGTTGGVWEYTFAGTTTLTVTNADDSGPGSLRDAMGQANQDGMPNEIRFGPWMAGATIQLSSELPHLNEGNTTIDGDIDDDCVPDVAIDGQSMPNANGININSNNNRVTGLAIHSFDCPGCGGDLVVLSSAHDNVIDCNYLGTDLTGTNPLGTQTNGVKVVNGSTGNQIGPGNRIVYNGAGIVIENGSSGNTIGPDNTVAFNGDGVRVYDGMDWAYPDFVIYTGDPIQVFPLIEFTDDGGSTAFHSADGITPVDSSGNTFHEGFGARFTGTLTVGTAGSYTFDLGHDDNVRLTVGGSELFEGGGGDTSVGATLTLGSHPIRIDFAEGGGHARLDLVVTGPGSAVLTTDGNTGGCAGGQPGLCGEFFQLRIPSDFNTITRNSIHDNGYLGINLESGNDGVTANDAGDIDIGPNTLLNFPEFTVIVDLGGGDYSFDGTAPPNSVVEIFAAAVDPSGHGEGKEYLDTLTADPGGAFSGSVTLPPGYFAVTATATDLDGNTSEFSYRSVLQPNFLTVDNVSDGGPGSLRDAIDQANADGVTTLIDFDPGLAGGTIQLFSELPPLTDNETTIDGDIDDDCMPDVALDGSAVGGTGLQIFSSSNLVQGLAIHSFGNQGVLIAPWNGPPADDNVLECNFIGTDLSGTMAMPNGNAGISIQNQATNNRIGGPVASSRNVISGNQWAGVHLGNTAGNTVEGNYLGTDVSGTAPLGNQDAGVHIGNTSGANQIGPDNVISANQWAGVFVSSATGIVVEGNFIGTDPSGTIDLGNQSAGIFVDGDTLDNRFGPGNVIAFNGGSGILMQETLAPDWWDFSSYAPDYVNVFPLIDLSAADDCSRVENSDGIIPLDGGGGGFIEFFSARFSGTLNVGTSGDYTFEFLDLNNGVNLVVDGSEILNQCCGTVSANTFLGAGSHSLELAYYLHQGPGRLSLDITGPGAADLATDGNLGGCSAGQTGLCGEFFQRRAPALGNTVTQNSIFDNQSLGIDLATCGAHGQVTPNDPGDADEGPNTLLNFPEFTSVVDAGGGYYDLQGTAPPDATVEIFAADADPSGHGEGKEYLGSVAADPSGDFSLTVALPLGYFAATATATDADGNTSEFSQRSVLRPNFLTVDNLGDGGPGSLRDAIDQGNADGVTTLIDFDSAVAGGTIQLLSQLPALTDNETIIDGDLNGDCMPDVELDGSATAGNGLQVYSSNNLIRGLAINRFPGDGLSIAEGATGPANDNVVECNFIGTDLSGTAAMPNSGAGLGIYGQAANNRIGGPQATARNLISGNNWIGLALHTEQANTVEGNLIGTDVTGTNPLGNQGQGIDAGWNQQIGPDNVISGNGWVGIYMPNVQGTVVEGNLIGTDVSGTNPLGNNSEGIYIDGSASGNRIGPDNTIGFNQNTGVVLAANLQGPGWPDFTDITPDATEVFPEIDFTSSCDPFRSVDGITPLDGGGDPFVEYFSARFTGTLYLYADGDYTFDLVDLQGVARITVDGGVILDVGCCGTQGTTVFLSTAGGPGHDIEVAFATWSGPARLELEINGPGGPGLSTDANIGGCPHNQTGLCGEILHQREDPSNNRITQNSIFDNQGLGIDLHTCESNGVTSNDLGDVDEGPNALLNFPEFTGSTDLGGGSFTVDGTAPSDSTVEIFAADADPSGHGEGREYLGTVTADPSGNFSLGIVLPAGSYAVTATATDTAGNTSEFSANLVLRANELSVTSSSDSGPGTLRAALEEADFDGAETVISLDPALAGQTIHLLDRLPTLSEGGTTLDGDFDDDCHPDIRLDGSLVGGGSALDIESSNNTVRGVAITNFTNGDGVLIVSWSGKEANNNVVECNYVGTELDGATPGGNRWSAVGIEGAAYDNQIGPGNVLAFNGRDGVSLWPGGLVAYPEFQGVAPPDPVQVFPVIDFVNDGGSFESADGIIPVDGGGNPFIDHFGARFTGTLNVDAGGEYTFDLPNADDNVRVVVDTQEIMNAWDGSVNWSLDAGDHAIEIDYWQWGGYAHLELQISGPGTPTLNTDGNSAGCPIGEGGLCGEFFQLGRTPVGNRITENSMHSNDNLGIDLSGDYVTPNDPGDGDGGPNGQFNYPELSGFTDNGGGSYTVDGTAPPDSTVELFGSDDDPSGHGEGKAFLGSTVADGSGNFSAAVILPTDLFAVTATATDLAGNTSEFSQNLRVKSPDSVTVGTATILQGDTGEVPIYVRDLSATPLGGDQPAGSRIQAFTFQVQYSPAASVAAISATRAGIAAGLSPIFETTTPSGNTITYLVSYDESTNLIPFTLDKAAPGDHVASLSITIDPLAPPTPVQLSLLGSGTLLSNQGGTLEENEADGTLDLFAGSVTVASRSATALFATGQSPTEIQLTWTDPQAGETGFRVERSPDGSSWASVASVGPDETYYLDGGLVPASLYYYRVISFSGGGDNLPSNPAAAETHPLSAAKTCVTQVSQDRSWARMPDVAWNGTNWGTVYMERTDSTNDELFFQFLHPDGSPAGAAVRLTQNDMMSQYPSIYWNGTNFGVIWTQHMRGPNGEITSNTFFALLDANGQILRNGVRLIDPTTNGQLNIDLVWSLVWDGGGWGLFQSEVFSEPWSDVAYWRFTEDGELLLGPVQVTNSPDREHDVKAAWNGTEYGMAWIRETGADYEVLFQRLLTDGTQPIGDPGPLQLWQSDPGDQVWYMDVVWNGAGWAVTWMDYDVPTDHEAIYLRLLAPDGTPLGPARRISDDFDTTFPPEDEMLVYDEVPELFAKPGGGYVIFTSSYAFASDWSYQGWEIARLEADAAGNRVGQRRVLSDFDGNHSQLQGTATNGSDFLVVYGENRSGSMETASVLVDAGGNVINGPHDLTCCHSPGNPGLFQTAGNSVVIPFQGGFVNLWTDATPSGSWQLYGQIFDAGGAPSASISPLSGRDIRNRAGAVAVGDTFAVAWKDGNNTLVFDRYDSAGGSLLGESEIAYNAGGPGNVALAYSGELYGMAYYDGNQVTLQRIDASGTPIGGPIAISDLRGGPIELEWTGAGWALVWRSNSDGNLHYALVDAWGSLTVPATQVTFTGGPNNNYDLLWTGAHLGLAWTEDRAVDPPGNEQYFTELNSDGSLVYPEVQVANPHWGSWRALLYWKGDRFYLVRSGGDGSMTGGVSMVEDEILPGGAVLPNVRQIANRGWPDALAFNGVTLAVMWGQNRELYSQTDACLADVSAPVCPDVAISADDEAVHLAWTPVDDPESGIWRYNVYRDGFMLAEQFATSSTLDDEGFHPDQVNTYEVRALNGAYLESAGCPLLVWSPVGGDANGDGVLSVLDIFYLINYFFAGGPAPMGDADANGNGSVGIADIFYLINYFYGGGPAPLNAVPSAAGAGFEERTDREAEAQTGRLVATASVADELHLPVMAALPRALVEIPIYLRDLSATPLGMDQGAGNHIQGLSLSVVYSPAAAVESITFARAGLTEGLTAMFETTMHSGNRISWIASFEESASPLGFDLDGAEPGDVVAKLIVRVDAAAIEGSTLDMSFDTDTTVVSNQGGTVGETAANGLLLLGASSVEVIDCSTDGDVALPNQTIDFTLVCEAGGSITAGPGLTIVNPADVLLRAGSRVVLAEGFSTENRFVVEIDPSLVP